MRRSALAALPVVVAALALPSTASAHLHSGLAATDYLARAAPLGALRRALTLSIYKTDRALRLTVRPGHNVTVIGYLGEPFIRIGDEGGVLVNGSSPTAGAAGLLRRRGLQSRQRSGSARQRRGSGSPSSSRSSTSQSLSPRRMTVRAPGERVLD